MARQPLTGEEISQALDELEDWQVKDGKLQKTYQFASFAEAIGWMVSVAVYADKLDHHPDWSNVYNKVFVELITHDLGALSRLDVDMAKRMDALS
jgi:4a-hydroxytetrahydrobiopterin dehydratase